MLKYRTLLKLFSKVYKYDLIHHNKLLQYRKVGYDWMTSINNNYSNLRIFHQTYQKIKEFLWYDKDEYDNFAYKRMMLGKFIRDNHDKYWSLKIPYIDVIQADSEILDQYIVERREMPDEYYILLHLYELWPSTRIKMYPIVSIQLLLQTQYKWLEDIIINMESDDDINNILLFTPICYIKHFKQHTDDKQYILVLCYINVVDSFLEQEFPFDYERYYLLELEVLDLEDNGLHLEILANRIKDLTDKIRSGEETMLLPKNIATQLESFDSAFMELLNHQEFNL